MPLSTILGTPEREFDEAEWDDEELGADDEELELDEFDAIDEDEDDEEI